MPPLTFEERYESICFEVDKRKAKWDLAAVDWEDARQEILLHIFKGLPTFDPQKGEFSHWVQRLIGRVILNIWRDNLGIYARPCVGNAQNSYERCVFNDGGDLCTKTPSGKQCSECRLFKDWEKRKKAHFAIKQTLPVETHSQEVSNIQSDFVDVADKKRIIDAKIREELDPKEWRVYKVLFIDGGTEEQAARLLGFKKRTKTKSGKRLRMYSGYASILKLRNKFVKLAREIIENEDLA